MRSSPAPLSPAAAFTAPGLAVTVAGVRKTFSGGVEAVAGVTLMVPPGQFLALLGPSGCGKSTLLRMVAGLEEPTGGSIALSDAPPGRRQDVAFVFQDPHLLPWRTVLRNTALPLELRGVPRRPRLAAARAALEQVGLGDAVDRYPAQLSGGMRMRASLARAVVTNPRLLLLDEPFAALDEITRQQLDEQLRALWRRSGMTVLFVTHSIGEAVFLAERAIVFSGRPARLRLDRAIDLPPDRDAMIRTTATFAAETREVFAALRAAADASPAVPRKGGDI